MSIKSTVLSPSQDVLSQMDLAEGALRDHGPDSL